MQGPTMLGTPKNYPQYIMDIKDPKEKNYWQQHYIYQYSEEYNRYDQEWNGLKSAMYGVSLIASGAFACIMLGTAPISMPLIVASIIATAAVMGTAAICTMIYYGVKADKCGTNINEMPARFPMKFELEMRKQQMETLELQTQHYKAMTTPQPPPPYNSALYPPPTYPAASAPNA